MQTWTIRAVLALAFIFTASRLGWAAEPGQAGPTTAPATDAGNLSAACNAFITSAIRSTYGWGWSAAKAADEIQGPAPAAPAAGKAKGLPARSIQPKAPAAPRSPRDVPPIDAVETAAVGVQLLWASQLLGNDDYRQAAYEAGRGLTAIQIHSGQVRGRGVMGVLGAAKEPIGDVPDRGATQAALGLWLELLRDTSATKPDHGLDRIRAAGTVASNWFGKQQATSGAWPSVYPPDAAPGRWARIVRMDTTDFRDNVYTLLLAADALASRDMQLLLDRAIDRLITLRISFVRSGGLPLWAPVYDLQGQTTRKFAQYADGVDLLASRYAMEALLGDYLISLKPRGDQTVREALAAVQKLPRDGKQRWHRTYDRFNHAIEPLPRPSGGHDLFAEPDETSGGLIGTFGLEEVIAAEDEINQIGGDRFGRALAEEWPLHRRVVAMLMGLSDDAMYRRLSVQHTSAPFVGGPSPEAIALWGALSEKIRVVGNLGEMRKVDADGIK